MASAEPQVRVGLLGLGVIGSGVARTLLKKAANYGAQIGRPLCLSRIVERDPTKGPSAGIDSSLITDDASAVLRDPEIQIVIELFGGESPAYEFIKEALSAGKYVVTANKEVMAKHGPELLVMAQDNGVGILYEASVGGGIPIIAPLSRDLLANDITAISAIINGTTNYILTRMSREGSDFSEALEQAQALGYAEADPTGDIEGVDAAYKLSILASLAFHTEVHPRDVYCEGITRLGPRDFRYARELGYDIKLLALTKMEEASVQARVHPVLLPEEEPLAKVDGVLNAVQVEGDLVGRVLFQGQGAGPLPTSSAVVADVLDAASSIIKGNEERSFRRPSGGAAIQPISGLRTRYYIRMVAVDQPGVLSQIARVLGDNQISIASVIQKEADETAQTAELVIMTHLALEASVQKALEDLQGLSVVREIGNFLRVEG